MQALARHLNLLLPTLCYYYKRREDVIGDIALRHLDELRSRVGLAMDELADRDPAAMLRVFAREFLLHALAERDFHRLMTLYPLLAGASRARSFRQQFEVMREIVEGRLIAHAPALAARPELAQMLSRALLDALSGASCWLEPYGPVKPVEFAAMVADWVLDRASSA